MPERYISLEEYAKQNGVSVNCVKRKHKKHPIGGIELDEQTKTYRVLKGTRYPYDLRLLSKQPTTFKSLLTILDALNHSRYIDAMMMKISEDSFQAMMSELLEKNLIKKNNSGNTFGTNGYDITLEGGRELQKGKDQKIETISAVIGNIVGMGKMMQGA